MKGIMIDNNHNLQVSVKRDFNGLILQGLVVGDNTFQNQGLIVLIEKGELKHAPTKGVGIRSYLDDEIPDNLLRAIRTELQDEGMGVYKAGFDNKRNLVIDAKYE
jgi:hypothetical protein